MQVPDLPGGSDLDYKREATNGNWKGDDSSSFAFGGGFKATLNENENVAWGLTGDFETEFVELQIAAGPTIKLDNGVSIYGGPFLHFVDGEHYYWGTDTLRSSDLEQKAELGGYVGAQVDIAANTTLNIEYQDTTEAWALAGGIKFSF